MRHKWISLLFLLCAAANADPPVRYHAGDDPRWAVADFDDSSWPVSPDRLVSWPDTPDQMMWVRTRVPVPANIQGPVGIMWPKSCGEPDGPEELFVNGVRIAQIGHFGPRPDAPLAVDECVYPIPPGLAEPGKTIALAFRVWANFWGPRQHIGVVDIRLDALDLLRESAGREHAEHRASSTLMIGLGLFEMLAGVTLLVLWKAIHGERLILLLGIFLVLTGFDTAEFHLGAAGWVNISRRSFLLSAIPASVASSLIIFEFIWAAYGLRRNFVLRAAQICVILPALVEVIDLFVFRLSSGWASIYVPASALAGLAMLWVSVEGLRRPGESRLVAIGILVYSGLFFAVEFFHLPGFFRLGTLVITTASVGVLLVVLPVAAVLVRNMFRRWKRRERLQADIEAAREVQSSLMPATPPRIPGFAIDAVYLPAGEVGGDCYQVLPCGADASLIVIGDVSGKGLKAAMVVSLVAGALRSVVMQRSDPAGILAHLNRILLAELNGGFVTCCCIRLEPSGAYTLANAGHIEPYAESGQLAVSPGLPLGVTLETEWTESTGVLRKGGTIVLISDGVVEARNTAGELYGFERTRELAGRLSATGIAETARAFGQEDDITVLSITCVEASACAAFVPSV